MTGRALRLSPMPAARPWGGGRYGMVDGQPIGELWISGDEALLPDGRTLGAAGFADAVPLVKLLDVAGLLSVQVHPDDAEARELRGPDAVGKHELWVALEAAGDARVFLGIAPGCTAEDLFSGDRDRVMAALRERPLRPGAVVDVPPGTVHAPGPGLVLYEVQQRSDLTFRLWDWGRDRPLHLEESRRVLRPASDPHVGDLPTEPGRHLVSRPEAPFRLELVRPSVRGLELDLTRPAVLTVGGSGLAVEGRACEPGSHWLLGTDRGRARVDGVGWGLLASF